MTGPLHRLRSVEDDPSDVQRLLSNLPDPGPMPSDLVERIQASLTTEEQLRRTPGGATIYSVDDVGTRRGPTTRFILGMSGAAAAAAFAGAVAVHGLTGQPDVSVVANLSSDQRSDATTKDAFTAQLTSEDYHAADLHAQAAKAFSIPAKPIRALAAESPGIGPLATPMGAASCLSSLGLTGAERTRVDFALFDGAPAAVLFTTNDAKTEARVVNRACGGNQSRVIGGPVSLD